MKRKLSLKKKCDILATRPQQVENLGRHLQALQVLPKNCKFKYVKTQVYKADAIRNSFISGLCVPAILENKTHQLTESGNLSRSAERAILISEAYSSIGNAD